MQQETFPPSTEKTFFLKGECWRSALYMVIGAAIACGLFPWGLSIQGRLSVLNLSNGFLIFAPCFIVGISLLLPRLKIDSKGIHRRIFYGLWDTWEWERFQPGIIREGFHLNSYLCKGKPFWSRKLSLAFYPEEVRDTVRQIFRRFVSVSNIVVPESIEITLDPRTLRFDESGITVNGANSEKSYRWIDIENVTAQKLTHDHLNFRKLSLSLPDDELKLSSNMEERQSWKGTEAEQILSFLHVHVPEDRGETTAIYGKPRTVSEAERRLSNIEYQIREFGKVRKFLIVLVGAILLLPIIFRDRGLFAAALLFAPVFYFLPKLAFREQTDRLKQDRSEIQDWVQDSIANAV